MDKYYLDTNIWMDLFEARRGYNGEPFGEYAAKLITKAIQEGKIVLSNHLTAEMNRHYHDSMLTQLLEPYKESTIIVIASKEQRKQAKEYENHADALHAIVARDNECIMVTRDKHFLEFKDIIEPNKPEDLI